MAEEVKIVLEVDDNGTAKVVNFGKKSVEAGDKAEKSFKKVDKQVGLTTKAISGLSKGLIAFFAIGTATKLVKGVAELTDEYKRIRSQLALVTSSTEELARTQENLFDVAQESRTEFETTVQLYARIARNTKQLAVSQRDLLTVTEAITKAGQIGGATTDEFNNAVIQLSQGFASGVLRGEELNSTLEQMPRLAEAIAKGMGKTTGELRKLGAEGKLTSEAVFNAIRSQAGVLDDEFNKVIPTISQNITTLSNDFTKFTNNVDNATGVSSLFNKAIVSLTNGVKELSKLFRDQSKLSLKEQLEQLEDRKKILEDTNHVQKELINTGNVYADRAIKNSVSTNRVNEEEIKQIDEKIKKIKEQIDKEDELATKKRTTQTTTNVTNEVINFGGSVESDPFSEEAILRRKFDEDNLNAQADIYARERELEAETLEQSRKAQDAYNQYLIDEKFDNANKQREKDDETRKAQIQGYKNVATSISGGLRSIFAENKAFAIGDILVSAAVAEMNILKQWAGNPLIAGGLSAGLALSTEGSIKQVNAQKFATGGVVRGRDVNATLNDDGTGRPEYVMNADAVEKYGVSALEKMNSGNGAIEQRPVQVNFQLNSDTLGTMYITGKELAEATQITGGMR